MSSVVTIVVLRFRIVGQFTFICGLGALSQLSNPPSIFVIVKYDTHSHLVKVRGSFNFYTYFPFYSCATTQSQTDFPVNATTSERGQKSSFRLFVLLSHFTRINGECDKCFLCAFCHEWRNDIQIKRGKKMYLNTWATKVFINISWSIDVTYYIILHYY